jgi:peptidoglycan/xylan/chitin deacetylase (PgdA/CDA1 family)
VLLPLFRHVVGNVLSPAGKRARLSILIYHHVLEQPDPIFPEDLDGAGFDQHMRTLAQCCNVLPLSEAAERLARGDLPARAACVTFDDGYENNVSVALPILRRHRIPAAFFITSSYLHGGHMWNDTVIQSIKRSPKEEIDLSTYELGVCSLAAPRDRRIAINKLLGKIKYLPTEQRNDSAAALVELSAAKIPANVMMSPTGVKTLREAGMEIGGHTVTHPILATLDADSAWREITQGKEALEGIIGEKLTLFAYPNGVPRQDYKAEHVDMVKRAGFKYAVSTARGAARAESDPFQLPRFSSWGATPDRFIIQLARGQRRSQTLFA